jgi:hypothetical protein
MRYWLRPLRTDFRNKRDGPIPEWSGSSSPPFLVAILSTRIFARQICDYCQTAAPQKGDMQSVFAYPHR